MKNLYSLYQRHPLISTDSRDVPEGSIFFALRGDAHDGNDFAAAALEKGAAWAVVDRPEAVVSDKCILVDNALEALQDLAARHRQALDIPILALTGSNGKTTTKELVARVLARKFKVAATEGNLNNHIGVPLTLLRMTPGEVEFGVVEMGANSPGEIALLCGIARPDFGLITNVGPAHLEGFGDLEGVKRAKGELFDYLVAHGGLAFYRADDPVLAGMVADRPELKSESYPLAAGEGLKNNLVGDYNRYNIAAAAAVGKHFGVAPDDIADAVATYQPRNNRSQRAETERNILIVDCYNANPMSMSAALDSLLGENHPHKVVILGDMLELGAYSEAEHLKIVEKLAAVGLEEILLVGKAFGKAAIGGEKVLENTAALRKYLAANPLSGKLILVKGSRGIGLEKALDML